MSKRKSENGHANGAVTAPVDDPSPVEEAPQEEPKGNLPVHVIRFGYVKASIWQNHTDRGTMYNVTVARIYRATDDTWHSSSSFGYRDLLALAKCLDWAHSYVSAQGASNSDVPF